MKLCISLNEPDATHTVEDMMKCANSGYNKDGTRNRRVQLEVFIGRFGRMAN